jgi:hypothetical protein
MPPSNLFSTEAGVSLRLVPIIPIKRVGASLLYLQSFTENILFALGDVFGVHSSVLQMFSKAKRPKMSADISELLCDFKRSSLKSFGVRCFNFLHPHTAVKSNNCI